MAATTSGRGRPEASQTTFSWSVYPSPAGSLVAGLLAKAGVEQLVVFAHAGFWTHATLVMIFLNLLPHSKHFHIITAFPNVFTRNLDHPGKLSYMGTMEEIMEKAGAAAEDPDHAEPVGVARIEHFTWKAILDFYTCTECGRCSDHCPAHRTGKLLSPKMFTLDLRDHLYSREHEFLNRAGGPAGAVEDHHERLRHERIGEEVVAGDRHRALEAAGDDHPAVGQDRHRAEPNRVARPEVPDPLGETVGRAEPHDDRLGERRGRPERHQRQGAAPGHAGARHAAPARRAAG